jgi:hypothetical protein
LSGGLYRPGDGLTSVSAKQGTTPRAPRGGRENWLNEENFERIRINDRGQIVMVGQQDFGPQRTLLLTPHGNVE